MNDRLKLAVALSLAAVLCLASCQQQDTGQTSAQATDQPTEQPAEPAAAPPAKAVPTASLGSGIDMSGFDTSVRPQDDFFDYVNGKWVAETPFPGDRARWGTFDMLRENAQKDVRALVEEVGAAATADPGSAAQKIRDFYNAYLDSERPNALGVEAIRAELDQIAAAQSHDDLFRLFSAQVPASTAPSAAAFFPT
jgi:endothelin-converting enzyme/putative endopeptidase